MFSVQGLNPEPKEWNSGLSCCLLCARWNVLDSLNPWSGRAVKELSNHCGHPRHRATLISPRHKNFWHVWVHSTRQPHLSKCRCASDDSPLNLGCPTLLLGHSPSQTALLSISASVLGVVHVITPFPKQVV